MNRLTLGALALAAFWVVSCADPTPAPLAPDLAEVGELTEDPEGGTGGAGSDENPAPGRLTGVPGIDQNQELEIRILDARGTGYLGGRPVPAGQQSSLTIGEWFLSDSGSEYEITLRSSLLLDGIVRLSGRSAFLVEEPTATGIPWFRVFGGQVSFYLPHLPGGELRVLTPAGPLVTRGAVFTVTVSPDFQVLVSCREGTVYLTGHQNAVALPGQVLVADRHGRGRVYPMTTNEALVFSDRWLKIMTEESAGVLASLLPRRLEAWNSAVSLDDRDHTRFLALWFREARAILGSSVPGPETWSAPLWAPVRRSAWLAEAPSPGLLGELP